MDKKVQSAIEALAPVIREATTRALDRAPIRDSDAKNVRNSLVPNVTKEIAKVVINQTNQEPWYQSRVTWGAIIAGISGLAGIAGFTLDGDDQAQIVNAVVGIVSAVAGIIVWYGRWRAKKPLGS